MYGRSMYISRINETQYPHILLQLDIQEMDQGVVCWFLLSVHQMFLGSEVPSLRDTPWMKVQVAVNNQCVWPVNVRVDILCTELT